MKRSRLNILVLAGVVIMLVLILFHNIFNNKNFMDANVISILQLFVIIIISYVFVQRNTDARKQVEIIDGLIKKTHQTILELHELILSYTNHILDEHEMIKCAEERSTATEKVRLINNYFNSLRKPKMSKSCLSLFKLINDDFTAYNATFEDIFPGHRDNPEKLKEIERLLPIIVAKLEDFSVELYFPSKPKTRKTLQSFINGE